jgi:hypothetical protein
LRTLVDLVLRRQARQYSFRFGCESCLHFDVESRRCSSGYPVEPHLSVDLSKAEALYFCKEFELE